MRFIHAADIHLDSPLRSLPFEDPRRITRLQGATREAFAGMVDYCIQEKVAFLLLAGDLYDRDDVNMQIAVFLRNQLSRLDRAGIRVVIARGNHDAGNRITSALDLPANTRVLSDKKPETVLFEGLEVPVAIHGQSFRPGEITENLAAAYPAVRKGCLNIGLLHTSLAGSPEHDPYAPCKLEELTSRSYAYWALGHVHNGEILAREPWVVYPGNIQGRHAKESGPKGCILVETEEERIVRAEPLAFDVVRWSQAGVDLGGADSEFALVERLRAALTQARRDADGRPAAVRMVLTGRTALHRSLETRPGRLRQTIEELAGETAGEDLWLEQIRNETKPVPQGNSDDATEAVGELIRIMRDVARSAPKIGGLLERELGPLRTKLPEELKELPALRLLSNPELAEPELARLEPRLMACLAEEEDS